MTIAELRELTDFPFECFMPGDSGPDSVCFAVPIPAPYGDDLEYFRDENGTVTIIGDPSEWEDAWERYISSLKPKRKNRTRKQAAEQGAITEMPKKLALITMKPYQNAMTLNEDKTAHLQPLEQSFAEALQKNYNIMQVQDDIESIPFVQYYDNSPQAVSNLDLITLRAVYTIFLAEMEKQRAKDPDGFKKEAASPGFTKKSVTFYIPDFMRMAGIAPNHNRRNEDAVLSKIASYAPIYGVLAKSLGDTARLSHYPVLQLVEHDAEKNTVEIMAPYISKIIGTIEQERTEKAKLNRPRMKQVGKPSLPPTHSYLIDSKIENERNRRAVELVCQIIVVIEQCGNGGTPHITVRELVNRCTEMKNALDAAKTSSDKSKILRRAFTKAWQLLETHTDIRKYYKNIQLPTFIPAYGDMSKTIEFPHEGKIKRPEKP